MAVPVPILAGMLHEQVFQNIPVDFSKMIFYHSALSAYRADNAFERKNLILVDMPYPDNFARNYYFTREFFQTCKNNLLPQGVVAVILPDIGLLDQQERQTAENIIRKTLQSVFANVIRIEGKHSVLFASDSENLSDDPSALDDRAAFLELYPSELLPANLLAVTLPVLAREKQEQLKEASVMETDWENVPLNTVNSPVLCYQVLRSEMLHGKKVPPWLDRILEKLLQYHYSWDKIWYWAGGIFMLLFLYAFLRYFVPQKAVHKNIFRSFENGFFAVGILLFSLTSLRSYDSGYGMGALAFHTFILCLMLFLFTLQPRDEGNWFSPFLCGILWIMIARNGINAAFPNLLLAAGACGICAFQHKISQQTIEAYDNFRLFRGSVLGITTAFFIFPLFMLLPYGLWIWAGFLLLIRIVHARMETDGMTIKPA